MSSSSVMVTSLARGPALGSEERTPSLLELLFVLLDEPSNSTQLVGGKSA
jgi:hypothetical protein